MWSSGEREQRKMEAGEGRKEQQQQQKLAAMTHATVAFCFSVVALAWIFSRFDDSVANNLPSAFVTVLLVRAGTTMMREQQQQQRRNNKRSDTTGSPFFDDSVNVTTSAKEVDEMNAKRIRKRFSGMDKNIVKSWMHMRETIMSRYMMKSWYENLSENMDAPTAARDILDEAFLSLETRVKKNINLPKILLQTLPELLQDAFEKYRVGKEAMGGDERIRTMHKDVVDESLASAANVHPAVRNEKKQKSLCRAYADALSAKILKEECKSVMLLESLSRELIVASIFMPTICLFSPRYFTKFLLTLIGNDCGSDGANEENYENDKLINNVVVDGSINAGSSGDTEENEIINKKLRQIKTSGDQNEEAARILRAAHVTGVEIAGSGINAFAVYLVAVEATSDDGWVVPRRYSNFEALHRKLLVLSPDFKGKLPLKTWLGPNLEGAFIEKRRRELDKYVQEILADVVVKDSEDVFHFFNNSSKTNKKPENAVSMTTALSGKASISTGRNRRILSVESNVLDSPQQVASKSGDQHALDWESLDSLMKTFNESKAVKTVKNKTSSTVFASEVLNGPMLGLFECIFRMHTKGVLRKAFVATCRQMVEFFLGSEVEDFVSRSFDQIQASFLLDFIRESVWLDEKEGVVLPLPLLSVEEEKEIDAEERERLRSLLLSHSKKIAPLVGECTASRGTLEILQFLQSETMCQHVGLILFETLLCNLIPEILL